HYRRRTTAFQLPVARGFRLWLDARTSIRSPSFRAADCRHICLNCSLVTFCHLAGRRGDAKARQGSTDEELHPLPFYRSYRDKPGSGGEAVLEVCDRRGGGGPRRRSFGRKSRNAGVRLGADDVRAILAYLESIQESSSSRADQKNKKG